MTMINECKLTHDDMGRDVYIISYKNSITTSRPYALSMIYEYIHTIILRRIFFKINF